MTAFPGSVVAASDQIRVQAFFISDAVVAEFGALRAIGVMANGLGVRPDNISCYRTDEGWRGTAYGPLKESRR